MIPQTVGALLAFLVLVAPGLTFEILREKKRVAAESSTFREISRVALSSLVFSAIGILVLGVLYTENARWVVNASLWLQQGDRYVSVHPALVGFDLGVELVSACVAAVLFHVVLVLLGRGKGSISSDNSWFEALRTDVPENALPWVHVRTKDGLSFYGYCRSYSPRGKPDDREIALEGRDMVPGRRDQGRKRNTAGHRCRLGTGDHRRIPDQLSPRHLYGSKNGRGDAFKTPSPRARRPECPVAPPCCRASIPRSDSAPKRMSGGRVGRGVSVVAARVVGMRVGVYVDGYNLYYGGRGLMGGPGVPGWRWLDIRRMSESVIARHSGWFGVAVERVVFCTARISGAGNSSGTRDQDVYLRALKAVNAVDVIELGQYVNRVATAPLAVKDRRAVRC